VAFAADHLARRLPFLARERGPLALDPAQAADDRQTHRLVAHGQRSGHADPAVRRIDPEVQVLDPLALDLHRDAADDDLAGLNTHAGD
jgi:hypothetical protein